MDDPRLQQRYAVFFKPNIKPGIYSGTHTLEEIDNSDFMYKREQYYRIPINSDKELDLLLREYR